MRTAPEPQKKNKAIKKVIVDQRRKERDAMRKREKAHGERHIAAGHRAEEIFAKRADKSVAIAAANERFITSLFNNLRTSFAASIAVDEKLANKRPALSLEHSPAIDEKSSVAAGGMGMIAYTDFRTITMMVEDAIIPAYNGPVTEVEDFVVMARGVFHHEAGHVIHTTPLRDMGRAFDDTVRAGDNLDIEDRLAVFTGALDASGDPQAQTARYTKIHNMWNVLEDQRMESARVRDFPACQRYFEGLIYDLLTKDRDNDWWARSWLLLAGREYLPMDVWELSSKLVQADLDAAGWLAIVRQYKSATTPVELVTAIVEALEFTKDMEMPPSDSDMVGEHGEGDGSGSGGAGAGDKAEGGASENGDGSEGGTTGDGKGTPLEDPDTLNSGGSGTGDAYFSKKALTDAIKKMKVEANCDPADKGAIRAAIESSGNLGLEQYDGQTQAMGPNEESTAMALSTGIQRALETYVTQATPTWQWKTEEGVIDACSYRSREPGDLDYRMDMAGEAGAKLDLHVSVLADVSYSMASHMTQLSTMLLGMKLAVDELGIPSNFTIWSDDPANHAIYTNGPEHVIFPALGGTNPESALTDAIIRNVEERPHHLVLILTDGHWYNMDSVAPWRTSREQQFVVVKYGQGPREVHDADALVDLPELSMFPRLLEDALDRMLAKVV